MLGNSAAVEAMTSVLISINKHHSISHSGIKVTGLEDWKLNNLELIALEGIPLVEPGDDIADIIFSSLEEHQFELKEGDVFVIAQKIISKSENRYAYLNQVSPSSTAFHLSKETDKEPKLVQLILDESSKVIRSRKGVIVVEH